MLKKPLNLVVFLAGLAAIAWIGAGYLVSNPMAALVALVIAACYLAGVLELRRYQQATDALDQALADTAQARADLPGWLARLPVGLRHAVRLRIEGERVALPPPALTPYLVGLLVLLGMLGTLLGMMATLRGTGFALESAADLQAIRTSLAAPVKGLGFAFGTSIAGVASSAMLGLLSALCRRERLQAVQRLDAQIATELHVHSHAWQRTETFRLLQRQAEAMPVLIDRLQALSDGIEQRAAEGVAQQLARQQEFHQRAEAGQAQWAATLERQLQAGVAEGARAAGAALQPVVEATMSGLAKETAATQAQIAQAVQRQLDGLSSGFAAATSAAATGWREALAEQRNAHEALAQALGGALTQFNEAFAQRSAELLDGAAVRLQSAADGMAAGWRQALSRQEAVNAALVAGNGQALAQAAAALERQAGTWAEKAQAAQAELQASLVAQDAQRLEAWRGVLAAAGTALHEDWSRAGEQAAQRHQETCARLESTAQSLAEQTRAQAEATIGEVARLVQVAAAAPQAAADVVAELRQKLSDSMARDTAMLAERNQMLATLDTLLEAVNHASTEQRSAIDALVATSADLLERVGDRFAQRIDAESGRLDAAAAQVAAGATEVASLGDALGGAAAAFGAAQEALVERLQGIENALAQSLARSDEQLAYYVAQAREVVDLSVLAQKQIVEELRQAGARAASGAGTA